MYSELVLRPFNYSIDMQQSSLFECRGNLLGIKDTAGNLFRQEYVPCLINRMDTQRSYHGFWNNSASILEWNEIGEKSLGLVLKKPSGCENTDEHIQRRVRIRLKRIVPEGLLSE